MMNEMKNVMDVLSALRDVPLEPPEPPAWSTHDGPPPWDTPLWPEFVRAGDDVVRWSSVNGLHVRGTSLGVESVDYDGKTAGLIITSWEALRIIADYRDACVDFNKRRRIHEGVIMLADAVESMLTVVSAVGEGDAADDGTPLTPVHGMTADAYRKINPDVTLVGPDGEDVPAAHRWDDHRGAWVPADAWEKDNAGVDVCHKCGCVVWGGDEDEEDEEDGEPDTPRHGETVAEFRAVFPDAEVTGPDGTPLPDTHMWFGINVDRWLPAEEYERMMLELTTYGLPGTTRALK